MCITKEKAFAWAKVFIEHPSWSLELDEGSTERAGYPIYRDINNYYNYVCDLNARLEVNSGAKSVNIYLYD